MVLEVSGSHWLNPEILNSENHGSELRPECQRRQQLLLCGLGFETLLFQRNSKNEAILYTVCVCVCVGVRGVA